MAADSRIFFRMDVGYFRNPKIAPLMEENRDAVFVHQAAIAYSREHLTDGVVPVRQVMREVLVDPCGPSCGSHCQPQCARILLTENGLFENIDARTVRVHDYERHNQTAADVAKAITAGQKGAAARWGRKSDADRNGVRHADRNGGASAHPNASTGEKRTHPRAGAPAREDRFPEFWMAYPKKVSKGHAEKAWAKAVKTTDPDVILAALAAQGPLVGARDKQYIPNPATWLNGERWTDESGNQGLRADHAFAGVPRVDELTFADEDKR